MTTEERYQEFVALMRTGIDPDNAHPAFGPFLHWLANRGYAVLYLNYRGSAGFGAYFRRKTSASG